MKDALIACHECDLLLRPSEVSTQPGTVCCPRCGAALYRQGGNNVDHLLALTLSALILLLLANLFPIVGLNMHGHQVETTVFGAARQLWHDNMPIIAALLVLTTALIPFIELAALTWLLLPLRQGRRPAAFPLIFRGLQLTHPWAMVEVFILGVLVSLVKLSHLANVLPGPAIWCFGALMLVLAALSSALDQHSLWRSWEAAEA